MYNISPLYTGENSAVKLPELDNIERSSRRAGEMAMRGEEMKLDKALKDKATFQKMLSIDPIMAVSTANATRQAQDLEKYNNKWADKYVKGKGELSFADEMEMSKDRKMLEAIQGKMLADQEQYRTYKNTILRDTRGYYDKQNFDKAEQEYFKTGELPPNMMDVAPQSMTAWLRARSKEMPTTTVPRKDAMGRIIDEKVVDKTDAQSVILEGMQEEARLKTIIKEFDQWTQNPNNAKEVYDLLKDYDKDKNGVISPEESQYAHQNTNVSDNPVAKWAMNNPIYLDSIMGQKEGASKNPPSVKKTSGMPTNVGGADLVVSPATKRESPVVYGDKTYNDTYAFAGNTTLSNLPTLGGLRFRGTSSRTLKMGNITGKLKDYVADGDMIIIEAATGIPELDIETKGLVAIPARSIQGADNLPIMKEGKQTTLGAIRGQKSTEVTKGSGLLDNL